MTISKEFLNDLKEKYKKTEELIIEKSKLDPETEPFKSHYEAKDILVELVRMIKNYIEQNDENVTSEDVETLQHILVHLNADLGKVHIFTEEKSTGESYLDEALKSVDGRETHPAVICAVLNALNEYGILWMNRSDSDKALHYLCNAKEFYTTFKETNEDPLSIDDLLNERSNSDNKQGEKLLEKHNVMTLFYLAQVYGSMRDLEKSAIFCHTTLKKQIILKQDYDQIDWALNAATLSQFFCTNYRYTEV